MTQHWMIDFDSVLSNTFKHQIEKVNERFGTRLTHEDFTSWNTDGVLTPEQADYMWGEEVFLNTRFQLECTPVEGARQAIAELVSRGDECVVVSDRPRALYDVTRYWLDANRFFLPLVLTRSAISKSDQNIEVPTKQQVVTALGLTRIVDDAPHHAIAFSQMPEVDIVYLMDTPSNQFVEENGTIVRALSWDEIRYAEARRAERRMVLA